jgi:STE24 endopeptidase
MDADWLYASYHYSHPILPERLGALGWKGDKGFYKALRAEEEKAKKEKDAEGEKKGEKDEATVIKAGDREL